MSACDQTCFGCRCRDGLGFRKWSHDQIHQRVFVPYTQYVLKLARGQFLGGLSNCAPVTCAAFGRRRCESVAEFLPASGRKRQNRVQSASSSCRYKVPPHLCHSSLRFFLSSYLPCSELASSSIGGLSTGGLHCTSRSRPGLNCPTGPLGAEFLISPHFHCVCCLQRHEEGEASDLM